MTQEDLIRGSQVILDFLLEDDDDLSQYCRSQVTTSKMSIMDKTLSEILENGNMIDFTQNANKEYKIMPEPLWKESAREFFSTDKSIKFFTSILRDKKIDQILS